jgi:quinohemoprotein ethanol dehydrogenase
MGVASMERDLMVNDDDDRGRARLFGVPAPLAVGAALLLGIGVILLGYYAIDSGGSSSAIVLAPEFTTAQLSSLPKVNWITNGGSMTNERYSSLAEIDTHDVSRLKSVWLNHLGTATAADYSSEAQPLEYEGTLYVSTGSDDVFAISVKTGRTLWRYDAELPLTLSSVCCGWDNRGVALGGGMVYISQLNGELVALNQRTGAVIWRDHVVSEPSGYTLTSAPLYYDGRVYTAPSGGEFGIRGFLGAYNAKSGALDWKFYTMPGPGETGHNTWPAKGEAWKHGGGGIWNTPSLDPKLNMLYFATSNPSPWDGRTRPGNNLFASSIVALDATTGKLRWYYQEVHHDVWDYDAPSPTVLFNAKVDGGEREAVAQAGKTGFLYVLDRKTGKPIFPIPERPVPYNPDQLTARKQPFPSLVFSPQTVSPSDVSLLEASAKASGPTPKHFKIKAGSIFAGSSTTGAEPTAVAPSAAGGDNWPPASFDPSTDDYYVCSQSGAEAFTIPTRPAKYVEGHVDVGLQIVDTDGFDTPGLVTAFDMDTGEIAWQRHFPGSCYSGAVSTAGGLVFVGNNDGELEALNASTGATMWGFQTGAGANDTATPFSYEGKEYVAFYAGGNALVGTGHADNFWLFSLNGTIRGVAAPGVGQGIAHAGVETKREAEEEEEAEGPEKKTQESGGAKSSASAGATIFKDNCGTCHTLAAAGTSGDVGPNLDRLKPSEATVIRQVNNGGGAMPAFGKDKTLTQAEIEAVAKYVSTEAGK